jgi:hypothetical protein
MFNNNDPDPSNYSPTTQALKRAEQAEAYYNLAWDFYTQDTEEGYKCAVENFIKAANAGHGEAQTDLGYCRYHGLGTDCDIPNALVWWKKAAAQGNLKSQYNLGVHYQETYKKSKNSQDIEEAVRWYTGAAKKNHAGALNNLGTCYEQGIGVEKDIVKAVECYRQAAKLNYPLACYNLAACYEAGEDVPEDIKTEKELYQLVTELYQKAADQGDEDAQQALSEVTLAFSKATETGNDVDTQQALNEKANEETLERRLRAWSIEENCPNTPPQDAHAITPPKPQKFTSVYNPTLLNGSSSNDTSTSTNWLTTPNFKPDSPILRQKSKRPKPECKPTVIAGHAQQSDEQLKPRGLTKS